MTTDLPICAKSPDNGALMDVLLKDAGCTTKITGKACTRRSASLVTTIPKSASRRQATPRLIGQLNHAPLRAGRKPWLQIATLTLHEPRRAIAMASLSAGSLRTGCGRERALCPDLGHTRNASGRVGTHGGGERGCGSQRQRDQAHVPLAQADSKGIADAAVR